MSKVLLFVATVLSFSLSADTLKARTLTKVMTLKIGRQGGTNGASVAWHPLQKTYYAAMAGSENFPLVVFDINGEKVSDDRLTAMFDVRGMWYNPMANALQMNGHDKVGWGEYVLDNVGIPESVKKLNLSVDQPGTQSVGVYDPKRKVVYFYDNSRAAIERHSMSDGNYEAAIILHLGSRTKGKINEAEQAKRKDGYNENAIVFTGIPHQEIGLLNTTTNQVELYDVSSGLMTDALKLPPGAPVELSLNFSYCNGTYWLFDKTKREWDGYKLK